MSAYKIEKEFIPGLPHQYYRHGKGAWELVVAHETGAFGGSAASNRLYESRTWQTAFVHFFVDWTTILQVADTDYIAYGAGPVANQRAIHVELVRTRDAEQFAESYKRYTWLLAHLLKSDGEEVNEHTLMGHDDVRRILGGTSHTDPYDYLEAHGISRDQFYADVKKSYDGEAVEPVRTIVHAPKTEATTVIHHTIGTLNVGDRGAAVKEMQELLASVYFYPDKGAPNNGIDGIYGPNTKDAVMRFQSVHGLDQDGIYGPKTKTKLLEVAKGKSAPKPAPKPASQKSIVPYPGHLIKVGSKGKDVERIQRAVGVSADGIFGEHTKKAVEDYQRRHGLAVDGIVGKQTWAVMF